MVRVARSIIIAVLGVALYIAIVYLAPSPLNIMAAPVATGILVSRSSRHMGSLKAFLLGAAVGISSYLAFLLYTGSLPIVLTISMELAGPLGVISPIIYHGVATGLVSLVAVEVARS